MYINYNISETKESTFLFHPVNIDASSGSPQKRPIQRRRISGSAFKGNVLCVTRRQFLESTDPAPLCLQILRVFRDDSTFADPCFSAFRFVRKSAATTLKITDRRTTAGRENVNFSHGKFLNCFSFFSYLRLFYTECSFK